MQPFFNKCYLYQQGAKFGQWQVQKETEKKKLKIPTEELYLIGILLILCTKQNV